MLDVNTQWRQSTNYQWNVYYKNHGDDIKGVYWFQSVGERVGSNFKDLTNSMLDSNWRIVTRIQPNRFHGIIEEYF